MALNSPKYLSRSDGEILHRAKTKTDIYTRAYHGINLLLGLAFVSVLVYSLVFRANNHLIPALLTEVTGELPPSKGLSASFSEIVRGNLEMAHNYNPYGIRIFAFFVLQILLRPFFSIILILKNNGVTRLSLADSIISIVLFTYCFWPLIEYTLQQVASLVQNL